MARIRYILLIITSLFYTLADAQEWSKADSLWLLNVLEGKQELRINEETKKAIEEGRLILPSWMKDENGKPKNIDILKNFGETGKPDSSQYQRIDPYSMPPAVLAVYVLYMDKLDSLYENTTILLTSEERRNLEKLAPTFIIGFSEASGYSGGHDFNHILSMLFIPSYRQQMRNRKYATSYKNYYDDGAIRSINMTESERRQLRQSLFNISIKPENTPGVKRNGIDD
jgi:hypothetical protein